MNQESMQDRQSFPATVKQIAPICSFILTGARQTGLDEKTLFMLELACDEAVTNITEHAYRDTNEGTIDAEWAIVHGGFKMTFRDNGQPFSPFEVSSPPSLEGEKVSIGGLGMHMMRETMDEVDYVFNEQGNQVTLVKWLPPSGSIWHRQLLDGVALISLLARLDSQLSPALDILLKELVSAEAPRIIVDLSAINYVNSGGLRVLVSAWRNAHQKNGDVLLCGLDVSLQQIFNMVGFNKIFRIFETLDDARDHYATD